MLPDPGQHLVRHITATSAASRWGSSITLAVALGVVYFLAARLSLALIQEPDGVAVFWPASGIAAGALIGIGSAARWPVIAATIGATVIANILGDRDVWSSMAFAVCNVGEAFLVATLIERFAGARFSLDRVRRVLGLFAVAIVGSAISGIGGTAGYVLFHSSAASALTIWHHWLASDAIGIISVAPLVIALISAMREPPPSAEILEGGLLLVVVGAFGALFVYLPSEPWADEVTIGLTLPLFLWTAARCNPIFTAAATSITTFAIVWAATFGLGIFSSPTLLIPDRIRSAQAGILIFSFCGLLLGALFSERRRHEAKLQQSETRLNEALQTAERADRVKSGFLAAASHDLRQPLQTLKFLHGVLERQPQNEESRGALAGIDRSLKTMHGMLSALLDIDRLEKGTLTTSMSDFKVNDIFDSIAADYVAPAKEKGLRLRLVPSAATIHSDRRLLEVMIRNLVSNAIRFTDQGKILIGCRRACDKLSIEVWDSGVGIMGDQIPFIFNEYYQTKEGKRQGGFGLGLAIVQRVGNVLEHPVGVSSNPGKGSGFFIEVPIGQLSATTSDQTTIVHDRRVDPLPDTILIIEDESFVRTGLDSLFSSEGITCVSVCTGYEALTAVTEKGMRPDLVISDYNLPGMNGVQSIEQLRIALAWRVPAVVLTGEVRSQAIEAIAQHDVGIAIKPVEVDELLQMVRRLHARSLHMAKAGGSSL
jgi:signal transduction histidine kinase/ActR/RegA family two-component response regulator